jgi:hypothetical protein
MLRRGRFSAKSDTIKMGDREIVGFPSCKTTLYWVGVTLNLDLFHLIIMMIQHKYTKSDNAFRRLLVLFYLALFNLESSPFPAENIKNVMK